MAVSRLLLRALVFVAVCGAAYLIYRGLSRYSVQELMDSLSSIPPARLAAGLGFAAASYACLGVFDALAVRYAGKPLPYHQTALASFTALSIGHNVGIAALSSGAIRYRFYSRWGLSAGDVAKVILFCGITVGLGLTTLGGIGLLLYPEDAEGLVGLGGGAIVAIALVCLALPIAYVVLAAFVRKPLKFRKWELEMPHLRMALAQVAIGTVNFGFVAACLHQMLAAFGEIGYLKAAATYVIANSTALVSHVPGGLGVLEATVMYLVPGAASIGALIAFRVIYYFVPLAFGLPIFLISEQVLRKPATS